MTQRRRGRGRRKQGWSEEGGARAQRKKRTKKRKRRKKEECEVLAVLNDQIRPPIKTKKRTN
jgi:hypothetical protein